MRYLLPLLFLSGCCMLYATEGGDVDASNGAVVVDDNAVANDENIQRSKKMEGKENLAPAVLVSAHIYKVKDTGALIYCSNKHPVEAQDHEYMGTANVNEDDVKLCEFEDA